MISPDLVQTMAAYNRWQNTSLYSAADGLDETARRLDRGAFFGSVHETLAHILWADQLWLSRFGGCDKPSGGIKQSTARYPDWTSLKSARDIADQHFTDWTDRLSQSDLAGDLSWFSGAANQTVSRPRWLLIQHMFNHQTHHRGQVHAMLTQAGARPDDTDLFLMPSLMS